MAEMFCNTSNNVLLPLLFCGNPVLRTRARPVERVTAGIRVLADQMIATMVANQGVGLAGPQVGSSVRLIAVDTRPRDDANRVTGPESPGDRILEPRMPIVLVNPEITTFSAETGSYVEGCLSVPEISAPVVRPLEVTFRTRTLDGECIQGQCAGLLARCLQHEIDHLNGVLFVDRLTDDAYAEIEDRLRSLEKRTLKALRRRSG